ncbi:MAG: sugar phosphate isomerase/epimerase [Rhizobiaceae bacterium]|nr:sugar phosphate isomerase/epimerase [Rhizobiaceae bacterium]
MTTLRSDLTFAMPFSNVLHLSFPDKVKATRLAGFQQMSIQPQEVLKLVAEGVSIADMRAMAADGGIKIARLDPLCPWVPDWKPTNFGADYATAHDVSPRVFFDLCDQLGCHFMSLNATFPASRYTTEQITGFYAEICRQAAEHGVTCDLECIPMWGVVSLEQGWTILRDSGASNGGFVFDCTHFTRSNPSLETLAAIPGELIHCVQVCDGHIPMQPGVTLEGECFERLWPGDGDFAIPDILDTLDRTGGLTQIGPEVFSAKMAAMSAEEVAERSRASLEQYGALTR